MPSRHEDLRDHLATIAEQLGDRALERLRAAVDDRDGAGPDPVAVAEERRLTRARRSVEKAIRLLDDPDEPDGP
jgi:hypothetical protein